MGFEPTSSDSQSNTLTTKLRPQSDRKDLNLQPRDPKSRAPPIELRSENQAGGTRTHTRRIRNPRLFLLSYSPSKQHARRDSNPQPLVLETGALPIELLTPTPQLNHPHLIEEMSITTQQNRTPINVPGGSRTPNAVKQLVYSQSGTPMPADTNGAAGIRTRISCLQHRRPPNWTTAPDKHSEDPPTPYPPLTTTRPNY